MSSQVHSKAKQLEARTRQASGNEAGGAWLLVLSIIVVSFILRAPITSVGPIVEQIQHTFGLSGGMTGLLTTLPLLAFGFISPFAPRIAARVGMEFSFFAALSLLTVAIIVRSLPSVFALFLGTILLGSAIAVANVLLPSLVKREYPNKLGLMTGVYTVAMNLGAAVGSGLSVPLTEKLGFSWQGTLASSAIFAFIATAIWLLLLKRKKTETNQGHIAVFQEKAAQKEKITLWRSPLAWSVSLFLALQSFCFYVNVTWIPLLIADKGLSHASAGWMLAFMQLVSMIATFIVPIVAGRRKSQRWLSTAMSLLFVIGYFILLIGGASLVPVSMVILGTGVGGGFGLAIMFFALRSRTSEQAAELSGMAQAVGYLLAASGPFLFGLLHDLTDNWDVPLLLIIGVSILYGIVGLSAGADRKV